MSILGHDKSVIAVLSLINHAGLFGRRIVKYEKRVSDKVHLHYRFFNTHWEELKLLGSYNEFGIFIKDFTVIREIEFSLF